MDLTGSLIDTNLRIYPTKALLEFLDAIPSKYNPPTNILKLINCTVQDKNQIEKESNSKPIQLNDEDIKNVNKVRIAMQIDAEDNTEETEKIESEDDKDTQIKEENKEVGKDKETKTTENKDDSSNKDNNCKKSVELKCQEKERENEKFLTTTDIDWLYNYVYERRGEGNKKIPYLHELLKGVQVEMPNNKVIKRNPVLEARCVKLRAQQEAREYRKMTKSVDNVRMRFPEDSINYQLKQVNRQLIAIGQFIISIFAGFLFGFRGVEWMVGNLDFGFRLLLGVMCALVIALAEIYFLAKKLNEELNVPETVQLGGPPKFADDPNQTYAPTNKAIEKQHQD
ncbi:uncharacterized protein LOC115441671 isoform X1 [Manduca sexta]|uniref:uncharacterized protein LOC115441671 isoform X1 n=1 Tax=Manduca sexta TaxID=7130 RepID=UPI00188ED4C9|nr:uncharacterized protein LOC115441671 isoform X1 [Manduca sexta]